MVNVNNLKNGKEASLSHRRKVKQDALGKVNRVKEIRRRGKDGLKINRQQHFVRKKVSRVDSVWCLSPFTGIKLKAPGTPQTS